MDRNTATITLPVSGRKVTVQEGDGYTDKILTQRNKNIFETIPEYIASLITSMDGVSGKVSSKDILDLLTPDQESLSIECYKVNYGNIFDFSSVCSNCGAVGVHSFDLVNLQKKESNLSPDSQLGVLTVSPDPTVSITLPRTKKRVILGLLDGHKEQLLASQIIDGVFDPNQASFLSIRSIDGSDKFSYEDIVNLPLMDHKALRMARRQLIFGYDTNILTRCAGCGEKNVVNILMNKDFLFPAG